VLNAAKIPYVAVPETYTEQASSRRSGWWAHAMDADARGTCLANAVAGDLAALKTLRAAVAKPVRVVFLLSFLNGRAMVAGRSPRPTPSSSWPARSTPSRASRATSR